MKTKLRCSEKIVFWMVEAGGVEPPSEKVTTVVSPGAVRNWSFASTSFTDKLSISYLDKLSADLRELTSEQPGLMTPAPDSQVKSGLDGYL